MLDVDDRVSEGEEKLATSRDQCRSRLHEALHALLGSA